MEGIARLLPGVAIVSEEAVANSPPAKLPDTFVLVDPLDGTREFIAGRDEFTINVAIVTAGSPKLGIVAAPARALLWRGIAGRGAERLLVVAGANPKAARECASVHTRPCPRSGLIVTVSRSHLDPQTAALLARLPLAEISSADRHLSFANSPKGRRISTLGCQPRVNGM